MERGFEDVVTVPRVGTNIRLQAVAAAHAASSHCHLNGNANSRRSECRYRGNDKRLAKTVIKWSNELWAWSTVSCYRIYGVESSTLRPIIGIGAVRCGAVLCGAVRCGRGGQPGARL